jgi:hypothetical protein
VSFTVDKDNHIYYYNKVELLGVNEILDKGGFKIPYNKKTTKYKCSLGKAIHNDTALYDKNDLDISTVSTPVIPYLEAWVQFKKDTGIEIIDIEDSIYSKKLYIAGTPDRIVRLKRRKAVLDIKTGTLNKARVRLQLAGYEVIYNENNSIPIKDRYSVQLQPDRTPPYTLDQYEDSLDKYVFLGAYKIARYKVITNFYY